MSSPRSLAVNDFELKVTEQQAAFLENPAEQAKKIIASLKYSPVSNDLRPEWLDFKMLVLKTMRGVSTAEELILAVHTIFKSKLSYWVTHMNGPKKRDASELFGFSLFIPSLASRIQKSTPVGKAAVKKNPRTIKRTGKLSTCAPYGYTIGDDRDLMRHQQSDGFILHLLNDCDFPGVRVDTGYADVIQQSWGVPGESRFNK